MNLNDDAIGQDMVEKIKAKIVQMESNNEIATNKKRGDQIPNEIISEIEKVIK